MMIQVNEVVTFSKTVIMIIWRVSDSIDGCDPENDDDDGGGEQEKANDDDLGVEKKKGWLGSWNYYYERSKKVQIEEWIEEWGMR